MKNRIIDVQNVKITVLKEDLDDYILQILPLNLHLQSARFLNCTF